MPPSKALHSIVANFDFDLQLSHIDLPITMTFQLSYKSLSSLIKSYRPK